MIGQIFNFLLTILISISLVFAPAVFFGIADEAYVTVPADETEKLVYMQEIMKVIEDGLAHYQEKIDVSGFQCDLKTFDQTVSLIFFDDPLNAFHLHQYKTISWMGVYVQYIIPSYWDEKQIQYIDAEIEKIVAMMDSQMSDLDKVIWINDYICSNFAYDNTLIGDDVFDMLSTGNGICSAYMQMFKLMADKAGLKSSFAISYRMGHVWNIVQVDGNWYNIDVTWNDQLNTCYILSDNAMINFHRGMRSIKETMQFVECPDTRYDGVRLSKRKDDEE